MSQRAEIEIKVATAEAACNEALAAWRRAVAMLAADVSVNGYGIIHDRSAFELRLLEARQQLDAALAAMQEVAWPTNREYDAL